MILLLPSDVTLVGSEFYTVGAIPISRREDVPAQV